MVGPAGSKAATALLYGAGFCFLFGAGATVVDVVLRAVNGANVPAAIELTSLLIGLGALLSIPVCYLQRSNVEAKLLSEMAPRLFARPLSVLSAVFSVLFAALLAYIVGQNAIDKLGSPETTSDLGLPMPIANIVVAVALLLALAAALKALFDVLRAGDQR